MRTIAFHPEFVVITGSVNAALLLSQILYWSPRTKKAGGWFYKCTSDWMKETGLTRHQIVSARRRLVRINVISEMRRGIPATVNFRLNKDILAELLDSSCPKSGQPVVRKAANCTAEKRTTNSEMTSESTQNKERNGCYSANSTEVYFPKIRYPDSEDEMASMLEHCGVEYNPDYDGRFFEQMDRNGWCINGEMVCDWIAVYQARVEKATTH